MEGKAINHHAVRRSLPCPINSPQEGLGAGMPYPKKSKADNMEIEDIKVKGKKVTRGVIAFGSR
jgi:hypothetical protein